MRNKTFEGFLLGCGITALIMMLFAMPIINRNRDFAFDMADLYSVALDDISRLQKVCGVPCENFDFEYMKKHNSVLGKP